MRVIPLGVGDAFSERNYSSALAVETSQGILLVDCPHPIRKMLREASDASGVDLSPSHIVGVALTHLHADHASGLESFAYFHHFAAGRRLRVLCHPAVAERLWDGHLAAGMEQLLPSVEGPHEARRLEDWIELVSLDEHAPIALDGFEVRCRRTIHHIPTTAFRIRSGGRELGYSADTAFDPTLIEWLAEADLVVHETNFGVHTPYEKLAELPAELRARMRLIHYPDSLDLDSSAIEPLREGRVYEV
ncbi:MAG: MBL fold metallo-hydrolase [Myxococcaceae bacterium]